jgi:sugar-specific transcriptional regulator TrmB
MAKNKRQPTGRALSAEQVLEREAARFEERVERARKELAEAEHELQRIRTALEAMRGVGPGPPARETDAGGVV